nr:UPF0194 membrane protein RB0873-like [Nerophis lumbriciformis]
MKTPSPVSSFAFVMSLCAILLTACDGTGTVSASERPAADDLRVTRGAIRPRVLLTGELEAAESIHMKGPNTAAWQLQIRWLAEEGMTVKAGDKVAEFDSSQLGSSLQELSAREIEAHNQLSSLRARLVADEAEAEFAVERQRAALAKARLEAEIPEGLEPAIEYQGKQRDYEQAQLELARLVQELASKQQASSSEIAVEEIALRQAAAEKERVAEAISKLTLVAPRDGLVILGTNPRESRTFQTSDITWPGLTVAEMPALDSLRINARLLDVDDGRVRPGMPAKAVLDAYPDEVLEGRVEYVEQIAQQLGRRSLRRSFRVLVSLDAIDLERMRPGMSVKVVIEGETAGEADLIPRQSLEWTDQGPRARLADGDWRQLELGSCDAWYCVVKSGLESGDRLAPATGVAR